MRREGGASRQRRAPPTSETKVRHSDRQALDAAVDLIAFCAFESGDALSDPTLRSLDEKLGGLLRTILAEEDFRGKAGQEVLLHTHGRVAPKRVAVLGVGGIGRPAAILRTFAVRAMDVARRHCLRSIAIVAPRVSSLAPADAVRICAEGAVLGAYRFDRYLRGERKGGRPASDVQIVGPAGDGGKEGDRPAFLDAVRRGVALGEAMAFARDLVNVPANDMTPRALGDVARSLARDHDLGCTVLGKAEIDKRGFGLLSAVNRGSAEEPRLIHLVYRPRGKPRARVAILGKGITFDSGGLCLKPPKSQIGMKCDMSGAAVVRATMRAVAQVGAAVELHGIVAATENMPGPNAYRPGDVFASYNGKTVEVLNTDAEGRLILADALGYAAETKPDLVIDHATLTNACRTALGSYTAGLFSTDAARARAYLEAADRAGESFWELPLLEELRPGLDSDIADLRNIGEDLGGAVSAALFLREFAGVIPWIHVDMAGPAYAETAHGYSPKGGTGFGILTLVEFLTHGLA